MSHIDIASDHLRARILLRGAALVGLRFADNPRNLVLGFTDPDDHARVPVYAGAIVGPIANRVRGGRVQIDSESYQMACNEGGKTALHSGPDGLHAQLWDVAEQSAQHVTLRCTLQNGACGLPGLRQFTATYTLADTTLTLTLRATTDAPTPINLAAHPYWNLDGSADISGHHLQIAADRYLPLDADNLPEGHASPVAATPFDFSQGAAVPLIPELDVNFCLSDHMRATLEPAAVLTGADGTRLKIATTAPGLQLYNGAYLPRENNAMADFPPLAPYAGIALEPQHWPDAPNHPHFPQITLSPDAPYLQRTTYHLSHR